MKIVLALAAALALGACNSTSPGPMMLGANCPAPKGNEVPSGCQIAGATYYVTKAGSIRTIEVKDKHSIAAIRHRNRYEAVDSVGTDPSK